MMVVFVVAALIASLVPSRIGLVVGALVVVSLIHPLLVVAVVAIGYAQRQSARIRGLRHDAAVRSSDALTAIELVGLGVTAGLPFRNAASLTADEMPGSIADEITFALRAIDAGEVPPTRTPEIRALFSNAAMSETTGTPLPGALNALALDRRRSDAAKTRERLAKLPVKLLFPLAFLILPGFVLLTVVPPLVSGLSRLSL